MKRLLIYPTVRSGFWSLSLLGNSLILFDVSMEISPRQFYLGKSVTHKKLLPRGCGQQPSWLSMGKTAIVTAPFMCDQFPQGEIALGKFPWIRQKEQKNYPWQIPKKVLWVNITQSGSTKHENVKIKVPKSKKSRFFLTAVFVLAPNPKWNWTQSTKTQDDFERFCDFFCLFFMFLRSTLKN